MALQLPEPDFYTLAEVAERWGVSEDVLVRMGVEKKIIIGEGYIPPVNLIDLQDLLDDKEILATFLPGSWDVIVDGSLQPIPEGPIPKKMYMRRLRSSDLLDTAAYVKAMKGKPAIVGLDPRRNYDDLVIPTVEIHRLEHQHKAAERAAADDVLGAKEKEKYQAMIAAMAQIIASKSPGYKHGDKPNAAQIAEAIASTGITERQPATMAKEISKAFQLFGR